MSLIDPITARMSPARPQNVPQTPSEAGSASKTTGAESVTWDLSQMFASVSDLKQTLADSLSMAESFALAYRGNVAALDIDGLAAAMKEMETLQDGVGKAYTYAYLNWSTDTADAERGALLQHVRESYTTIAGHLLFFELEWTQVEDKRAAELLSDGSLSFCRHYLEVARLQKPYLLSEEGERVMMEKGNTGRSAWNRFFDETLSDMRFEVDGVAMTQQQVLARLHDKDRETPPGCG